MRPVAATRALGKILVSGVALIVIVVLVGLAVVAAGIRIGRGLFHDGPDTSSSTLAGRIGASDCDNSGYYIQNRFDGSNATIYDCTIDGVVKCVTEEGGIAHDSTDGVRLAFSDTLGNQKPACIT